MVEKVQNKFIGFLANTDSTILGLKLGHGFQIESLQGWNSPLMRFLEPNFSMETWMDSFVRNQCYNSTEKKYFIVTSSFKYDRNNHDERNRKLKEFYEQLYNAYLEPTLRLLRLYKKGNICIPVHYDCSLQGNKLLSTGKSYNISWHVISDPYRLNSSEIPDLNIILSTEKLPFQEPVLELAMENYDLAYRTLYLNLQFLSLMNGLEVLFNDGKGEITYKLSRYTAVLIGNTPTESEGIFKRLKKLYGKRSHLVHNGKADITEENVLELREYLRASIMGMYQISQTKNEILETLDGLGFGEKDKLYKNQRSRCLCNSDC